MQPVIVLVTFYSRCGSTEKLASSAAVGAVQARANIRLRRVLDLDATQTLKAFPDCRPTLERMHKEYVPPTEADLVGADAVVLASPAGVAADAAEWAAFRRALEKLKSEGKLAGKVGAVVESGSEPTTAGFALSLREAGFTLPPDGTRSHAGRADGAELAKAVGRTVTELVRSLRAAPQ
jgi:multimeric flavodoxin WrbA